MLTKLTALIAGLATVLLVIAIVAPYWESTQYDQYGRAVSHAGLWQQVISFRTDPKRNAVDCRADGACDKHPNLCRIDETTQQCRLVSDTCAVRSKEKCGAKSSDGKHPCHYFMGKCRQRGDFGTELDLHLPYADDDVTGDITAVRVLGIVAACLAGVACLVASMSAPRPLLVAMISSIAALCATALLVVYGTQLRNSFSANNMSRDQVEELIVANPMVAVVAAMDTARGDRDLFYEHPHRNQGMSFVLASVGAALAGAATVTSLIDRVRGK